MADTLKTRLATDTKAALLGGDRFRGEVLRNLKAAILNEEVAAGKRDEGLADGEIEVIIAREVKKRRESIALYEQNGREDLADVEKKELTVLEEYLPTQLSEDKLQTLITEAIEATGASGPQAMGQVIGAVKAKVGTSADGATVARLVKEALN